VCRFIDIIQGIVTGILHARSLLGKVKRCAEIISFDSTSRNVIYSFLLDSDILMAVVRLTLQHGRFLLSRISGI
jgi:hypothetical protein